MIPITAVWSLVARGMYSPYVTQILLIFWICQQLCPRVICLLKDYYTVSLEIDSKEPAYEKLIQYISDTTLIANWRTLQMEKDTNSTSKEFRISPGAGYTWVSAVGLWIQRIPKEEGSEGRVVLRCLGRSATPINNFTERARIYHQGSHVDRIEIFVAEKGSFIEKYTSRWVWGQPILRRKRSLHTVFLDKELKDDLIADIERFWLPDTEKRYHEQGIPYRRCYLFHGIPRTGKTSLALAIAGHFNLGLRTITLNDNTLDDGLLGKAMSAIPHRTILLLEDVDAIGRNRAITLKDNGRDEVEKGGVSLSGLLNALDGMYSPEGYMLIMTTNHKDKLDPALIQPGRVDRAVEFTAASQAQAKGLFKNMFLEHSSEELESLAEQFSEKVGRNRTPADLQNYLQSHDSPTEACDPSSERDRQWLVGAVAGGNDCLVFGTEKD
jgi:hypothetical protein